MTQPAQASLTRRDGRTWGVYCISAGRPANVPAMQQHLAPDPVTWVVPHAERHDYATAGAHAVLPVRQPAPGEFQLPVQRQAALLHAVGQRAVCIQTDDDLRNFRSVRLTSPGHAATSPAAWPAVRDALLAALTGDVHLAGLPPTDNAWFATRSRPEWGLVRACLTAADTLAPGWDPTLPVKEDYDYTCQHLATYGTIARVTGFIAKYDAYTNRGGVVALRTPAAEAAAAAVVLGRWPQYVKAHRSKPNEVGFLPVNRAPGAVRA